MADPKKLGSYRRSHCQKAGRMEEWGKYLGPLLFAPALRLLLSLVSQIYPETREQESFLVHREENELGME